MTATALSPSGAAGTQVSESLIVARDLALGYGSKPVLEGVSCSIEAGSRVAVLGPNGGGKTTLLRALLGEIAPLAGSLHVAGRCALVPQTERSRLDYPVSALDVALMGTLGQLAWWRRPGGAERDSARQAMATVGLAELADETFGSLSGGQRQRVLIARALVQDALLMLLDEPFSGLDSDSSARIEGVIDRLAGEGRVVLIATHDLEQARRWDNVLCLNRRQIAFGSPDRVLDRATLEATYGGAIVELPGGGGAAGVLPPHHHHHGGPGDH